MKQIKRVLALALVLALAVAGTFVMPTGSTFAAAKKVNTKKYTISKKGGTYTSAFKLTIKAKKGYKVYYSTKGTLSTKKVIQSGKSKTLAIKKTTTLSIYAVKSSKKLTAKQLKATKVKSAIKKYKYKLKAKSQAGTSDQSGDNAASDTDKAQELSVSSDQKVDKATVNGITTLTITEAGTYTLSGGTKASPVKDTVIAVNPEGTELSDTVTLVLGGLVIDDSLLGADLPVISIGENTKAVRIQTIGSNSLTGSGTIQSAPASGIIYASDTGTTLTFSRQDSKASLTVMDSMPADTDFGKNDPSDGISAKGTLVFEGGSYQITANGACLKATGKGGTGGITVSDGTFSLVSYQSNALKSKNGTISIEGGSIASNQTGDDAINAKNYKVSITGGKITIDNCYGDGIQGEEVEISGDTTVLSITTYFENAGTNYYDTSRGAGNYNTLTEMDTRKSEVINVDTGSHKGIKAGTKAKTYSYATVESGSSYTAGKTYSAEASGGLTIAGGTITIDTTNTGLKYNGANDSKVILGAPEDAIKSNNTMTIAGGTLTIASSDDGISGANTLDITGKTEINITTAYEGMEAGRITIGKSGETQSPSITIYSNDDGINASSKTLDYAYTDEDEEQYTKTSVSNSNNTLTVNSGYVNVMIADDEAHSYSLSNADGTKATGNYSADGDGIDCNGSFYANGGTVVVYGATSGSNSPIDTDGSYVLGSGATVLAVGSSGMGESPTSETTQSYLLYGNSGGMGGGPQNGMNGMQPGAELTSGSAMQGRPEMASGSAMQGGPGMASGSAMQGRPEMASGSAMQGGPGMASGQAIQGGFGEQSAAVLAGTTVAVLDSAGNMLTCFTAPKAFSYILYSSPSITKGAEYTIVTGGTISGKANDSAYDYRGTAYSAANSTTLETVTGN